ncbi:MAG: hypothetical protein JW791_04575 [Nanoarchaeota archaeon]|nr:hypothetical protein [Nanoarchaeota archaeon]
MSLQSFLTPGGEKLFIKLIISGMIFLTLTGFNTRFLPCDSVNNYCSMNYLQNGESYNNFSLITVFLTFSFIPYISSCFIVQVFK